MEPDLTQQPHDATQPLLLVEKEGELGKILLERLSSLRLTIFVSKHSPTPSTSVIHVPFHKKIPVIPDNKFSHLFIIYHGEKELLEALPAFITKAKESNGKVVFITTIFQRLKLDTLTRQYPDVQFLLIGDLLELPMHEHSPVQKILQEARLHGRVSLPESGLNTLYPVSFDDVLEAISAIAFQSPHTGVFALYPQHSPTSLSFVRLLQKNYPLLQLDFLSKKEVQVPVYLLDNPKYIFASSYPLESRLKAMDLTHTPLASPKRHKKSKRLSYKPKTFTNRPLILIIALLSFFLSLPFLASVGLAAGSGVLLLVAQNSLERGELEQARNSAGIASSLFSVAEGSMTTLKRMTSVVGLGDELVGFESAIQSGGLVAQAIHEGASALILIQEVSSGKSAKPEENFYQGLNKGKEAIQLVQRLGAEKRLPARFEKELGKWQPTLALITNTMDSYPYLFGFEKEQKYLVLFQNNFELRPTGGFIGSYGLLTLEKGRVVSFTVHDVYDADGKLKEKVVPPYGLSRHLGASNWFMRDSNYYIDFPTSAATIANFLKLETGEKVDGVIGIDVYFLASILDATGPLKVADYNETLTSENFFLVTENYVEKDFFPGSTQKKDFLNSVKRSLEDRFQTKENISYAKLAEVLTKAVLEKHVVLAFADEKTQQLFKVNNLSASVWDPRVEKEHTFSDYISFNETNVGLNKSNYYLERSVEQKVAIDGEGRVSSTISLNYKNTSTKDSPFGGEYKAYLRFVLPEDVSLTQLRLDGVVSQMVPAVTDRGVYSVKNFTPPSGVEVEETKENGKKIVGILVTVPVGQQRQVSLDYTHVKKAEVGERAFNYDLLLVKQPGTLQDKYKLALSYPVGVRLINSSEPVSDLGGKLLYETTMEQDRKLNVSFARE